MTAFAVDGMMTDLLRDWSMECLVETFSLSALVWLLTLAVATLVIFRRHIYNLNYTWPPGPWGWPVLGNSLLINPDSGQTSENITRIGKKYHPDMFTLSKYFGKRIVILNSYKSIKEAFIKQAALVSDRPSSWGYTFVTENRTNIGVFLEAFTESFKREKKYMIRTIRHFGYGTSKSQGYILREANHLVDLIKKRNGQPFDLGPPAGLCLLNVTFSMIFSRTYEEDDQDFAKMLPVIRQWLVEVFKLYDLEPLLPFFDRFGLNSRLQAGQKMTSDLCAFIQKHIDEHRATLDPDNPRDMVDEVLIDMAKNDPNGDLREMNEEKLLWMILFFVPNQGDTASGILTFMMLATTVLPEVQQRVYEEIQDVLGDRPPTLDDKDKMPYTEAVILESLRVDSTFWLLVPHFTSEDIDLLGFKIPKDTEVIPNIYAVHMDPQLWGDPENFRPERFIDENGRISRPEYFIPYSIGRRRCIGEQMSQKEFFLFYIVLLQKFKFKIPDGDPIPKLESQWLFVYPPDYRIQAEVRD